MLWNMLNDLAEAIRRWTEISWLELNNFRNFTGDLALPVRSSLTSDPFWDQDTPGWPRCQRALEGSISGCIHVAWNVMDQGPEFLEAVIFADSLKVWPKRDGSMFILLCVKPYSKSFFQYIEPWKLDRLRNGMDKTNTMPLSSLRGCDELSRRFFHARTAPFFHSSSH